MAKKGKKRHKYNNLIMNIEHFLIHSAMMTNAYVAIGETSLFRLFVQVVY